MQSTKKKAGSRFPLGYSENWHGRRITSDEDDGDFGNLDVEKLLSEILKDKLHKNLHELNTFVEDILNKSNFGAGETLSLWITIIAVVIVISNISAI